MSQTPSTTLQTIIHYLNEVGIPVTVIPEYGHEIVRPQFIWLEISINWCSRVEIHDMHSTRRWYESTETQSCDILIQYIRNNYCLSRHQLELANPNFFEEIENVIRSIRAASVSPFTWELTQ